MRRALVLLLVLLALPTPAWAGPVEVVGALPSARVGAAAVAIGDGVIVAGGRLGDNLTDEIVRWTPTGAEVIGALPSPRYQAPALADGSDVFLFGGAAHDAQGRPAPLDEIVVIDAVTGAARVTLDKLPDPAWGAALVEREDGVAFLFGGLTTGFSPPVAARHDWVLRFDPLAPEGHRLTKLAATLPFPVQDAAAARVGAVAYLMGGLGDNVTADPCPPEDFVSQDGHAETYWPPLCKKDAVVAFDLRDEASLGIVGHLDARIQYAAGVTDGATAYAVGGVLADDTRTIAARTFTPGVGAGVAGFELPEGRFGAAVAPVRGATLLLGGRGEGETLLGDVVSLDVAAPWVVSAPRALRASSEGVGVDLAWHAPALGSATGYRVFRGTDGGPQALLADLTGTSFHDATAQAGQRYAYRVVAMDGDAEAGEAVVSGRVATAPEAPRHVAAHGDGLALADLARVVAVSWDAPADDGGAPILAFEVWRAVGHGERERVATLPGSARSFDDHAPLASRARYDVVAVNVVGASPRSRAASPGPLDL